MTTPVGHLIPNAPARKGARCLGLVLGLLFATRGELVAQPPEWPYPGDIELRECGTGKLYPKSGAYYQTVAPQVIKGSTDGVACLKRNPKTPTRAKNLEKLLQSGKLPRMFFNCSPYDIPTWDPSGGVDACGATLVAAV